ncbi:GNAT family N-acetyltransferase [Halobellus ordinarius]|uniref:GNAT family N-acetyltransferase n=1 Tax=Halobellus ordinarius TaxID=3075120 RepID=UPI002880BA2A|nr:GNAT family N-acetyltransferase [Halobellus sp. ZY16]
MATKSVSVPDGPEMETTREGVTYRIRPYERNDTPKIVALLSAHQYAGIDEEWFRQTYVANPYVDHVPLFVVETDGDIVGVRPFTAFRVRAGEASELALLTRDTLIHPDHRRRGLFTAMTELALQHYETAEPAFVFSHSNHRSFPGYRKMGWSSLGHRETYCRVQTASALVDANTRDTVTTLLSPVASVLSRTHLAVRDRISRSPADITVTRTETVPEKTLASLYRQRRPEEPHIVRDEAFYRWRFRSSEWQPNRTYIARRGGEPLAGLIALTNDGKPSVTSIVDLVPRTGGENWTTAIGCALDHLIADHSGTDILKVSEPVFPPRILRKRGFLSSSRLPLSVLADESRRLTLGLRPLRDEVSIDGHPVDHAAQELWSVSH